MTQPVTNELTVEQSCLCGHSAAAHEFASSGKCSFCSCQVFDLHIVQSEALTAIAPLPPGLASDAGYIVLREMAERLGIAAARLRRAAAKRAVPAVKVARRWAVRPEDVPVIEAHFSARTPSQRAQAASSHDMAARLRHRGRVVSDAVVGEQPVVSLAGQAHAAEQGALKDILRPNVPPPPQRSM
jgi:hypothetical protein